MLQKLHGSIHSADPCRQEDDRYREQESGRKDPSAQTQSGHQQRRQERPDGGPGLLRTLEDPENPGQDAVGNHALEEDSTGHVRTGVPRSGHDQERHGKDGGRGERQRGRPQAEDDDAQGQRRTELGLSHEPRRPESPEQPSRPPGGRQEARTGGREPEEPQRDDHQHDLQGSRGHGLTNQQPHDEALVRLVGKFAKTGKSLA